MYGCSVVVEDKMAGERRIDHGRCLATLMLTTFWLVSVAAKPPHIILFLADDVGWNDVGFHNEVVFTPNIDAMATEGTVLNQSYVLPTCSPSRHALLTGRYPFRDGLQHLVFSDVHPKCVPLDLKLLPESLKEAGYSTHLVGKWHLGHCNKQCTPTNRGFDSFYGFYGGENNHLTHRRMGHKDFRDGEKTVQDKDGQYSAHLFTERAQEIVSSHNKEEPLFLFMSYGMAHYPVQAPEQYTERYSHIENEIRRKYLAMVTIMDESIGNISRTLQQNDLLKDALVIFMSDNGGQPKFAGNNYPLRGAKLTLWEGGTRSPTVISGGYVKQEGMVHDGLFHISDWYPTLMEAAGKPIDDSNMDGISQVDMIRFGGKSRRQEFVYNLDIHIDDFPPVAGYAAYRYGDYKLMMGYPGAGDLGGAAPWIRAPEQCQGDEAGEDKECIFHGMVHGDKPEELKANFRSKSADVSQNMKSLTVQLFNLKSDPEERHEISTEMPEMTSLLKEKMEHYMKEVAFPMMPRVVTDDSRFTDAGFHSSDWCSTEQLHQQRRESLSHLRKHPGLSKDTCGVV